jgi:hypothetical protein
MKLVSVNDKNGKPGCCSYVHRLAGNPKKGRKKAHIDMYL